MSRATYRGVAWTRAQGDFVHRRRDSSTSVAPNTRQTRAIAPPSVSPPVRGNNGVPGGVTGTVDPNVLTGPPVVVVVATTDDGDSNVDVVPPSVVSVVPVVGVVVGAMLALRKRWTTTSCFRAPRCST